MHQHPILTMTDQPHSTMPEDAEPTTQQDSSAGNGDSDVLDTSAACSSSPPAPESGAVSSDTAGQGEPHAPSTEEQERMEAAEALKQEGNELYNQAKYLEASERYWQAVDTAPDIGCQKAVYYANLAACSLKLQQHKDAVEQCTAALKVDPGYVKAYMRRAAAFEALDDLEHALQDAQKVLELSPDSDWAARMVAALQPRVTERQEKMKEEMLSKLKDLGNTVLGKFGLSLDNFKADKDPTSGGYSIKFQQ